MTVFMKKTPPKNEKSLSKRLPLVKVTMLSRDWEGSIDSKKWKLGASRNVSAKCF